MWAEIHVFRGRMFVTGTWGMSGGVAVDDSATDATLGEAVLAHLNYDVGTREYFAMQRLQTQAWADFCTRVAGVEVREFRPEKRIRGYSRPEGLVVDNKPNDQDDPGELVPRGAGPAAIGAVIRRRLAAMEPRWPEVRGAIVQTTATHTLVVLPHIGAYLSGPCHAVDPRAGADALATALTAALVAADAQDHTDYVTALAAVGLSEQLLAGGARIRVSQRSDGTVEINGYGMTGDRATEHRSWSGPVADPVGLATAVLDMVGSLPTQHLPPGTPTGESFGYKCAWLAVRGATLAAVAGAVGLAGAREVPWTEGIDAAYDEDVFVSPPTAGWVFVVGRRLLDDAPDIADLSRRLGTEVQLFRSYRVPELHEWARATDGRVHRRVRCVGESGEFGQHGTPTPIEEALGIPAMTARDWRINEATVMKVAGAWSVSPQLLYMTESSAATGLCGSL